MAPHPRGAGTERHVYRHDPRGNRNGTISTSNAIRAIGKVTRTREIGDKTSTETAYYLFSAPISAQRGGEVVRSHWGVENSLHWRLDVTMNQDAARNRMDNGPYNFAILRHMALNVMGREESKASLRAKFKKAAWNQEYLVKLLALF
jgi:predicted transposase YbfD/YdcC